MGQNSRFPDTFLLRSEDRPLQDRFNLLIQTLDQLKDQQVIMQNETEREESSAETPQCSTQDSESHPETSLEHTPSTEPKPGSSRGTTQSTDDTDFAFTVGNHSVEVTVTTEGSAISNSTSEPTAASIVIAEVRSERTCAQQQSKPPEQPPAGPEPQAEHSTDTDEETESNEQELNSDSNFSTSGSETSNPPPPWYMDNDDTSTSSDWENIGIDIDMLFQSDARPNHRQNKRRRHQ